MSNLFSWADSERIGQKTVIENSGIDTASARSVAHLVELLCRDGWPISPQGFGVPDVVISSIREATTEWLNGSRDAGSNLREVHDVGLGQSQGSRAILNIDELDDWFNFQVQPIRKSLGARCNAGIFSSSANFTGFDAHYDLFHSVLIQLNGSKSWNVGPGPVGMPVEGQDWPDMEHLYQVDGLEQFAVATTLLEEGSGLWIPPGWVHYGVASEAGSLHCTVGVDTPRLCHLIQWIADSAEFVEQLRSELPPANQRSEVLSDIGTAIAVLMNELECADSEDMNAKYQRWRRDQG